MKTTIRTIAIVIMLLAAGLLTDGVFNDGMLINEAEARIGRPLTPGSVAGVARRTTRRRIRRTSVYLATLPRGCTTVVIEGASCHQCGSTYYQASGTQYVQVIIE
jgi:hypothetical protein